MRQQSWMIGIAELGLKLIQSRLSGLSTFRTCRWASPLAGHALRPDRGTPTTPLRRKRRGTRHPRDPIPRVIICRISSETNEYLLNYNVAKRELRAVRDFLERPRVVDHVANEGECLLDPFVDLVDLGIAEIIVVTHLDL